MCKLKTYNKKKLKTYNIKIKTYNIKYKTSNVNA